jgi:CRISPR-associated endonuclease/helicase Cas3
VLGEPTTFWGKIRRPGDGGAACQWHPLFDHCADVAAVAEALLSLPVWRRRLARLAGHDLGEGGWARLCVLATLHDLGKLNLGFQAKGRPELGPSAGHVTEALGALFRTNFFSWVTELAGWGEGVTGLLVAAICHHGRPHNSRMLADGGWQATWWMPRAGLNPQAGAAELVQRCRTWFPKAFATDTSPLPEIAALEHGFAGLVMLADWVGSDTRFFQFSEDADSERMTFARTAAREAVAAMGLDLLLSARSDPASRDPFTRVTPADYLPRPAQDAILTLPQDENGSITILEAETGSGKTEAALARFVTLFEAGLVDGLYFALPTRSAATEMHGRVHAAVQRAFTTPPAVILAVPGYLRVDDVEGEKKLARFEVLWPDSERFRYRAWAAENAKRYLAGCILVGTIDQVLLSSLMVGHAHLRATALLRHLLVVDEVHASDAYMARILEDVLARHMAAGGHALLLSATLGSEAKARLVHPHEHVTPPSLELAETTPYPFITHRSAAECGVNIRRDGASRTVEISAQPWLGAADLLARAALGAAEHGAKVLVIKNTVNDCIDTQLAVERAADVSGRRDVLFTCSGVAAPHHARFARADREALDVELEARIGQKRPEGGCIVVATQTVQQSLDLDADILFSDLCPADVLLQRLGRLHRHARSRPKGFETARATVIVPTVRDLGVLLGATGVARNHHGLGSVYRDLRMLEGTWRLIERHTQWSVPAMSRHLVEQSLHSSVLDAIAKEGGPQWEAHADQMTGAKLGERRQAELNLVDWSRPYSDMSFPGEVDQRIATRLGEGDRRVQLKPPVTSPFNREVAELVLRAWWTRGVASDVESAEHVASAGGVTHFTFGGKAFVYDRLGLRAEPQRSKEVSEDDGP